MKRYVAEYGNDLLRRAQEQYDPQSREAFHMFVGDFISDVTRILEDAKRGVITDTDAVGLMAHLSDCSHWQARGVLTAKCCP